MRQEIVHHAGVEHVPRLQPGPPRDGDADGQRPQMGRRMRIGVDDDEGNGQEQDAVPINLLIAKQRNGPTGDVNLTFLKSITRFESAAKISGDDVPAEG